MGNTKTSCWPVITAAFVITLARPAIASGDCDGSWTGHFRDGGGADTEADMTISGTTGKWLVRLGRHRFMNSPCREVEFPVQVLECSVTKFIFHVDGESLISGCPTFTARLIRKDANTAEGVKGGKKNPLQMKRDAP